VEAANLSINATPEAQRTMYIARDRDPLAEGVLWGKSYPWDDKTCPWLIFPVLLAGSSTDVAFGYQCCNLLLLGGMFYYRSVDAAWLSISDKQALDSCRYRSFITPPRLQKFQAHGCWMMFIVARGDAIPVSV